MNKRKTSIIWHIPLEDLIKVVKKCDSISCILRQFNINPIGGNIKTLSKRLKIESINYDHIPRGYTHNLGRKFPSEKIPLNQILIKNSTYSRHHLKKRLLNEGILQNKCCLCGLEKLWQGKEICLQLDHINGIADDNRIENLRILCPNCHSQTDTFSGKQLKQKFIFCSCGAKITRPSKKCRKCFNKDLKIKSHTRKTKIKWPSYAELLEKISKQGFSKTGRELGVSDNSIRKRLKNHPEVSVGGLAPEVVTF